jgi:hypothetical protein
VSLKLKNNILISLIVLCFAIVNTPAQENKGVPVDLGLKITSPKTGVNLYGDTLELTGEAYPGSLIKARSENVLTDSNGIWKVTLRAPSLPGSYDLKIEANHLGQTAFADFSFIKSAPNSVVVPTKTEAGVSQQDNKNLKIGLLLNNQLLPNNSNSDKLQELIQQGLLIKPLYASELASSDSLVDPAKCLDPVCGMKLMSKNNLDYILIGSVSQSGLQKAYEVLVLSQKEGGRLMSASQYFNEDPISLEQALTLLSQEIINGISIHQGQMIKKSIANESGSETDEVLETNLFFGGTPIRTSVLSGKLSLKNSPYLILSSISVPSGKTLEIDPGVVLYIMPGEFISIEVFGQLIVNGAQGTPVKIRSASKNPQSNDWNSLVFTSKDRSVINYLELSHATVGVHVENSAISIQNTIFKENALKGIFVRNSDLDLKSSMISGSQTALHASTYSDVRMTETILEKNKNGLLLTELSQADLNNSVIKENDKGIVLIDTAAVYTMNSRLENNETGISSNIKVHENLLGISRNNRVNLQQIQKESFSDLLKEPDIRYSRRDPKLHQTRPADFGRWQTESDDLSLNHYGNLLFTATYHDVRTSKNRLPFAVESGDEKIASGDRFPNQWVVPGWTFGTSVFTASEWDDKSFEFSMDAFSNEWNRFYPKPFSLTYKTPNHLYMGGYFIESGSELSMNSVEILGGKYQYQSDKNKAGDPWVELKAIYGESKTPYEIGDKNPDSYPEVFESGSVRPQELIQNYEIQVAPFNRFKLFSGFISTEDKNKHPLIRSTWIEPEDVAEPLKSSKSAYMGANWRSSKGGFELDAQVSFGGADTVDAVFISAVRKTYREYGKTMPGINVINDLFKSRQQIQVADSSLMAQAITLSDDITDDQRVNLMRDTLAEMQSRSAAIEDSLSDEIDEERIGGINWETRSMAARLGMIFRFENSTLNLSALYTGQNYYSGGNQWLLENSRFYDLSYTHQISPSYQIETGYNLEVNNAGADDGDYMNYLGMGEGDYLGLKDNQEYKSENVFGEDRPLYNHLISLRQNYILNPQVDIETGFSWNWRHQYLNSVLTLSTNEKSAIWNDPWFAKGSGTDTALVSGLDSTTVNSERWSEYLTSTSNDTLAWGLKKQEITKGFNTSVRWRFSRMHSVSIGTRWEWNDDFSVFKRDHLIKDFDFKDTTWEKLGYYFNGNDFVLQSYPMTLTNKFNSVTHRIHFQPQWKSVVRNSEEEFQWTLGDRIEYSLLDKKMKIGLTGGVTRRLSTTLEDVSFIKDTVSEVTYRYYHIGSNGQTIGDAKASSASVPVNSSESYSEPFVLIHSKQKQKSSETDINAELSMRYNWTPRFYSELVGRYDDFNRPDSPIDEYQDLSGAINLYYSF